MAHDITKDVIGCKEFEVQKINISGEPAEFLGSISADNHIVNKAYVDSVGGTFNADIIVVLDGAVSTLDGNVLILQ